MAAAAATSSLSLPFLPPSRSLPSRRHHRQQHALPPLVASLPRFSVHRSIIPRQLLTLTALGASAQEEGDDGRPTAEETSSAQGDTAAGGGENAEATARRILSERAPGGGSNLWGGVAEEVGEIEWPAFGKVVGTTGVVLAVIAGSSVALLTVNAVLAELSDRIFAGRGVQDFF